MPEIQTLDELKAENAKSEEEAVEESATETEEAEETAAEETEEATEEPAEAEEEEAEEKPAESWMMSDDESDDDEHKFSGDDMAKMRKKLQAKANRKIEEKDSELERLKAEVEQLKSGKQASAPGVGVTAAPDRYDFDDDASYNAALGEWAADQAQAKIKSESLAAEQQAAIAKAKADREKLVNAHYERAAKLAKEHGIDAEVYQASDLAVRKAVASVGALSEGADQVVDHIISLVGDGSEKLMYHLGRNSSARNSFRDALEEDPNGIKAAILLGQMKEKLTAPKKVKTAAKPAKRADGDTSSSVSDLHRKYKRAKSAQEKYDIRYQARKAGQDVSGW